MSGSVRSRWRRISRDTILRTLAAMPACSDLKQKRQALHDAYPFNIRECHPCNVWCAECRLLLGMMKPSEPTRKAVQLAKA